MKLIGVYRILNKVNKKCYIGSSVNIKERIRKHKFDLRKNKHENQHLQNAWNKYGEENFKFIQLFLCKQSVLIKNEQAMIDYYEAYIKGYNLCPIAGNCLGFRHSEESKEKMMGNINGRGRKGCKASKEAKLKMSKAKLGKPSGMKGKHHSIITKRKMSDIKLGKPSPRKGVKLTKETKIKMSLSHQGLNKGMKYRKKKVHD